MLRKAGEFKREVSNKIIDFCLRLLRGEGHGITRVFQFFFQTFSQTFAELPDSRILSLKPNQNDFIFIIFFFLLNHLIFGFTISISKICLAWLQLLYLATLSPFLFRCVVSTADRLSIKIKTNKVMIWFLFSIPIFTEAS